MPRYRSWSDTGMANFCGALDARSIPYKIDKFVVDTGSENVDALAHSHGLTRQKETKK